KVDTTKTPMTIDATVDDKAIRGIFVVEGDTLKICAAEEGQGRPTEFKTEAGSEAMLMILKRVTPDKGQGQEGGEEARLQEEVDRLRTELERTREALEAAQRRLLQIQERAAA